MPPEPFQTRGGFLERLVGSIFTLILLALLVEAVIELIKPLLPWIVLGVFALLVGRCLGRYERW